MAKKMKKVKSSNPLPKAQPATTAPPIAVAPAANTFKQAGAATAGRVWNTCTVSSPRFVGVIGQARIYGGGWMAADDKLWHCIIDAASSVPPRHPVLKAVNVPESLAKHESLENSFLAIDWPDGGIPQLSIEWWRECVQWLMTIEGNVLVCCHGGIGRTGTMLAALFGVYHLEVLGKSEKEAGMQSIIDWVRAEYHMDAIETAAQIDYLEHDLGLPVDALDEGSIYAYTSPAYDDDGWSQFDDTKPYGTTADVDDVPHGKEEIDKMFEHTGTFCYYCLAEVGQPHKSDCEVLVWEETVGERKENEK